MINDERELAIYSGNIIRKLRKEYGYTQKELGEKIGVSNSAIANYEKGFRAPLQDTLFKLAEIFNVSVNYFFPYESNAEKQLIDKITEISSKLTEPRQTKVYNFAERQLEEQNNILSFEEHINKKRQQEDTIEDYLDGAVSAGSGEFLADDRHELIQIPTKIIPDTEYDLILQVNGDSMEPMFEDHEYIFVKKTSEIRSGQIGVFIIDGESYLKKAYIEDKRLRLVSLNTKYEDLIFDDVNEITVVGTVVM